MVSKNLKTPNLSPMADGLITRDGIGGLGSSCISIINNRVGCVRVRVCVYVSMSSYAVRHVFDTTFRGQPQRKSYKLSFTRKTCGNFFFKPPGLNNFYGSPFYISPPSPQVFVNGPLCAKASGKMIILSSQWQLQRK